MDQEREGERRPEEKEMSGEEGGEFEGRQVGESRLSETREERSRAVEIESPRASWRVKNQPS